MSCNLCHEPTGHKPACPTLIRVDWLTNSANSPTYEVIARKLFDKFADAELFLIGERGSSEDENKFNEIAAQVRAAFDVGKPEDVLTLLTREGY